jgi:prepilin-type N-terminal cleavage/methylation domain-containing protein
MKVSNRILAARIARRYNQQGLTLIELLVVLVILIALAGILIPQLPSMLTRAHATVDSTNLPEQNKRIQEFEQIYFKQPANYDNLVNGTALVDYLPGTTDLTATPLTPGTRAALFNAGITSLAGLYDTSANLTTNDGTPTVNPYDATADLNLTAGTPSVAFAAEAKVESLLRPDSGAGDAYVALGVGQKSEMIGRVMSDAPIHFGEGPEASPGSVYGRYLAIYKVANDGTALEKAVFVGTLIQHDDGLANAAGAIEEFYEANQL